MNALFEKPELMQQTLERQGFFSLPPEMQPMALAQLIQQSMPQQPPQNWLSQFVNAAKVFNPTPGRPAPKTATVGVRG